MQGSEQKKYFKRRTILRKCIVNYNIRYPYPTFYFKLIFDMGLLSGGGAYFRRFTVYRIDLSLISTSRKIARAK